MGNVNVSIYRDWTKLESSADLVGSHSSSGLGALSPKDNDLWQMKNYHPRSKRRFDLILAILLLPIIATVIVLFVPILYIAQGRPIFYRAPRANAPGQTFLQLKFRSMLEDADDNGATGAHKQWRITRIGKFLRRTRIDELPQIFNILRGDMSFVGPRPPMLEYVKRCPDAYDRILRCRPGVTGLATLIYHRHEDWLMARCNSPEMTEHVYYRRCLPTKFRIEQVYMRHRSMWLDLWIIWNTVKIVVLRRDGRPRRRRRGYSLNGSSA